MAGEFADLLSVNQVGRVTAAITTVIAKSFQDRPGAMTGSAVKDRFRHLEKGFRYMRGDLKWSIDKCCDHLAEYLQAKLDGVDWIPNERICWMPSER